MKVRRRNNAMRAMRAMASIVAALSLAPQTATAAREVLSGPVPARIVKVIGGDTLVVRARIWLGHEVETRVRLAGLDAPEMSGRCPRERELARAARAFLLARLDGAVVTLHDIRYGKFAGRVLARIETRPNDSNRSGGGGATGGGGASRSEDLGAALLAAGLARPYDGRRRLPWCETDEAR